MSINSPTFISTFRSAGVDPISIRAAIGSDDAELVRLAERDSTVVPREPLLVAEVGGALRAAISLADGATIADPFHPTADLVSLLRARARHARTGPSWPGRLVLRSA
jgi:hypothetical protein